MADILLQEVSQFGGRFPDIPISEAVQSAFVSDMADTNPMYVTLPIGKVGAESRNGRIYPKAAYEAMVNTINTMHPPGQLGHLRESDRSYVFNVPPLVWMGALIEGDGTVWGKAYVMPHAVDVRNYIKSAKITKANIGTSLYGLGDVGADGQVTSLQIESIDLVHPSRVGVPQAAASPIITKESVDSRAAEKTPETKPSLETKDTPMPDDTPVKTDTPVVSESVALQEQKTAVRNLTQQVTELTTKVADFDQLVTEMGKPADPIIAYRQMKEALRQIQAENVKLLEEAVTSSVKAAVAMETVRPIVETMIKQRKPDTKVKVEQYLAETLDDAGIKALLTAQRVAESGDPHKRGTTDTKADAKIETTFYAY